jgi:hypothetical protein
MRKFIILMIFLSLSGCSSSDEKEKKAYFLGLTSGLSGSLNLLPLVERSPDSELKQTYAKTLALELSGIISLNPVFKDLDAIALTPICEAATIGVPFLTQYAPADDLTKLVIEYLISNKEEIVATFESYPSNKYGTSHCSESLRTSIAQPPNKSFKADAVPARP